MVAPIYRLLLVWLVMSVCNVEEVKSSSLCQFPGFPRLVFDQLYIFTKDRPLIRPEDGKALPDGRLVVADERYGLVLIEGDTSNWPFGRFVEAGYVHRSPEPSGVAQTVFLEHDTRIYRVDIQTVETRLIYDHPNGSIVCIAIAKGRSGLLSRPTIQKTVGKKISGPA